MVVAVIDGDAIEIEGGQRVRYGNGKLVMESLTKKDKKAILIKGWSCD